MSRKLADLKRLGMRDGGFIKIIAKIKTINYQRSLGLWSYHGEINKN